MADSNETVIQERIDSGLLVTSGASTRRAEFELLVVGGRPVRIQQPVISEQGKWWAARSHWEPDYIARSSARESDADLR